MRTPKTCLSCAVLSVGCCWECRNELWNYYSEVTIDVLWLDQLPQRLYHGAYDGK